MTRLVLALVLLLPTAVDAQHVHTDRPRGQTLLALPKAKDVWHFAVFGDRTGGPPEGIEILRQAVHDTNLLDPDLVMTVGDLVEGYNTTEPWLVQMREFRESMEALHMPWFPVAGNHDIYWRGPNRPAGEHEESYETHFGPLWYWFPHKNAAFVVLYSDEGNRETGEKAFTRPGFDDVSPEQLKWLRSALEQTKSYRFVFVFLHHPRWLSNYHGNWDRVHDLLAGAGNVKAVFAGHVHRARYSGERDGIEYFVLATTGGVLGREAPEAGWLHHFDVVTVRDDEISVAAIPVGEVIDPRALTDETLAVVDRVVRSSRLVRPKSKIGLRPDGSVASEVAVELHNPSSRPIELTVEFDAGMQGWIVQPDHAHFRLAPGVQRQFTMACERAPHPWEGRAAQLAYRVEILTATQRIPLPERKCDLEFEVSGVPAALWEPRDHGLVLDGRSCVRVDSAPASPPQGALTLEGWIRADDYRGRRPFVAKSENSEYYLFVTDGKPSFGVHLNGSYVDVTDPEVRLVPGTWHHLAGVFDGTELRLYVDGRRVASKPSRGNRKLNRLPLYIGADPNRAGKPVDRLKGWIDEVRLSTTARYAEDFAPAPRFEPDPATHLLFHFDHDLGPFALDHSPSEAHSVRLGTAHSARRPE